MAQWLHSGGPQIARSPANHESRCALWTGIHHSGISWHGLQQMVDHIRISREPIAAATRSAKQWHHETPAYLAESHAPLRAKQ